MRRRRKTRYTWLPIQNGATFGGDTNEDRHWQQFVLDVPPTGDEVLGVIPVVADLPQGTLTTVESEGIGEIIGNEYILKRIVGKCFVYLDAQNVSGEALGVDRLEGSAALVTAGFFVAPADPQNLAQPIGGLEGLVHFSPQIADNTRQPWIWRRSWILSFGGFGPGLTEDLGVTLGAGAVIRGLGSFPQNNYLGSVQDGPHVDAKTGRRIRLNERLWFTAAANFVNPGYNDPTAWNITAQIVLDCRYLGALRKARGRSNFT